LIAEIVARRRLPILVGGTGQYMRAILQGWTPPRGGDREIRARLEAEVERGRGAELVERLKHVDPASAATIDPRNLRRIVRALEVYEATGVAPSEVRGAQPPPFSALQVGLTLPRPELYQRIDARIDQMISGGLVEEVRRLLARGCSRSLPSMSAIGYREVAAHLSGEMTLDEAVRRMRRATRILVRRQANWFRESDPAIRWFTPVEGYEDGVVAWVRDGLRSFREAPSFPEA
jgi:tRNA dimethylallyltransferase